MMKSEFESLLGRQIPQSEYDIIEKVYTFHPLVGSKQDSVDLYNKFGMVFFQDSLARANAIADLEPKILKARHDLDELVNEHKRLRGEL